jgi:hypothetical protein
VSERLADLPAWLIECVDVAKGIPLEHARRMVQELEVELDTARKILAIVEAIHEAKGKN